MQQTLILFDPCVRLTEYSAILIGPAPSTEDDAAESGVVESIRKEV